MSYDVVIEGYLDYSLLEPVVSTYFVMAVIIFLLLCVKGIFLIYGELLRKGRGYPKWIIADENRV